VYYEAVVATEDARARTWAAERSAAELHRYRHLQSKETKVLTAVVTSLLALFVR
jgi:hypothetical protein